MSTAQLSARARAESLFRYLSAAAQLKRDEERKKKSREQREREKINVTVRDIRCSGPVVDLWSSWRPSSDTNYPPASAKAAVYIQNSITTQWVCRPSSRGAIHILQPFPASFSKMHRHHRTQCVMTAVRLMQEE